ncbi:diaminopimelate dehydrogenase [Enterococcus raffinosus]|uniref:Meso-diaminopimelate D-dehydrogenase n=1 Tax=Enterococcus raffinosus TaxID=71452 RepID=A0AAW8TFH6_9ENTE|nr:diaminopimelate dehydrogenase [Enterococcus raffinosus]MDT2524833.1 diaminopimelate dehydrogenase [Enterococcus raffinosus]MDT2530843.1 diaminopimelate dehydrogenase [Enterococcus raffinosus]MDT2535500.1 diaminopimelate dehydrogenase [Enterococcus raffinosus]MDT2545872.1 diaminopimelate dehydrogenase [Enterococcus raffinosus]MDT2556429.1 diaminopimelate dehydrogenase [Enterococcus raffinosus]
MIKIAIVGYGNLGRGVERALKQSVDMELVGVFSRRNPATIRTDGAPAFAMEELIAQKGKIDVCILCGGSATDLPVQTPEITKNFNTIDSFDTHAKIPEHYANVDQAAKENQTVSIISTGWDPGLFSLNRLYAESILPQGETYTFWGKGVSQGHSDALRRIEGVTDAIQYTIPKSEVIEKLKAGEKLELTTRDKHLRECFVVLEETADEKAIKEEIVTMPNYFDEYDTIVHFITAEELKRDHHAMPHGGTVLRTGTTHEDTKQVIEYNLQLESNPEFTASVLVAYARACARLAEEKQFGAFTVLDIAPKYLSPVDDATLRKELL